jgi:hypothetical protein
MAYEPITKFSEADNWIIGEIQTSTGSVPKVTAK